MRVTAFLLASTLAASPLMALAEATPAPPVTDEVATTLAAIQVTAPETRLLERRVIASGLIAPLEEVQVQPLIEGQPVEALLADVGDMVATDAVLAQLSRTSLELARSQNLAGLAASRAAVAQAEAQLIEAQSSADEAGRVAERTAKLRAAGTSSQAQADSADAGRIAATARVMVARQSQAAAQAQLELSEAQLANVELQLTRTEVRAPYAGRITQRNATIGAVATAAGQPMFVLEKDGALELRAEVAEADLLALAPGQKARLTGPGLAGESTGVVRLIEPAIDLTSRLGRARITLDAPEALRAGMYLEATIITEARDALALPLTALGADAEGRPQVLRVGAENRLEAVLVQTGIRDHGLVEITEGLAAGDLVVARAGAFVRAGERISPVRDTAAPPVLLAEPAADDEAK